MAKENPTIQFHYKDVLGRTVGPMDPAIFSQATAPEGDKPVNKPDDGFRIPLIYFSWGVLVGDRDPHHHPDNDELLVVLKGTADITRIGPGKVNTPEEPDRRFEETYQVSEGDVVLFPQGWVHTVDEADDDNKVLAIFNNQAFKAVEDVSLEDAKCPGENA